MLQEKGFSLIELIVVIVLLGILASVAYFRAPNKAINLYGQTMQLASSIRYTQSLAMARGERLRIDFSSTQYTITKRDGSAISQTHGLPTQITLPANMTLTANYSFIVFSSLGVPYEDANLPGTALSANVVLTLSASGQTQQLTLSPQTGAVTLL